MEANSPSNASTILDESLLIKAFDDSVKMTGDELARRIADATNVQNICQTDESNAMEREFEVGDYARTTYDDGIDYEVQILTINKNDGTCTVEYIGYGNEQTVYLSDLVCSWGKKQRRQQVSVAKSKCNRNNSKSNAGKKNTSTHGNDYFQRSIPPPPPIMPEISSLGNSEHISAMLMSWYMSGYYTGVYQGLQMAQTKSKSKK